MTRPAITNEALDAIVDALLAEAERQRELAAATKDVKQRGPG